MKFRYLRDPLFVACFILYFVNRWLLRPAFSLTFLHSYLNDVICIPFWVPIMLYGMRRTGLRRNDDPPHPHEVIIPLLIWSAVFELWLPQTRLFQGRAVADPLDIMAYTLGALGATLFWQASYGRRHMDVDPVEAGDSYEQ